MQARRTDRFGKAVSQRFPGFFRSIAPFILLSFIFALSQNPVALCQGHLQTSTLRPGVVLERSLLLGRLSDPGRMEIVATTKSYKANRGGGSGRELKISLLCVADEDLKRPPRLSIYE